MNRSLNLIGVPANKLLVLFAAALIIAIEASNGGTAVAQIDSPISLDDTSSRRTKGVEPPLPTELQKSTESNEDEIETLESDVDDSDSEKASSENDASDDDDRPSEDDKRSADEEDLDDEADDDEEADAKRPERVYEMKMIDVDTRPLRINITELNSTVPDDESSQLLSDAGVPTSLTPSEKRFAWAAPNIRYQPLYFENVPLERYGQTPNGARQTLLSAAHFFKSAALLPYQLIETDPHSCDGPLGFCRPGTETPFVWQKAIVR